MKTESITVYIANDIILHHVQRYAPSSVELFVNGQPIPAEYPQALPAGWTITAKKTTQHLTGYQNEKTGGVITKDMYDDERMRHSDHDGEWLSREDELAWLIYSRDYTAVHAARIENMTVHIVKFYTIITGEPYITCIPSFVDSLRDDQIVEGKYFIYEPDEIAMLKQVITDLGMDISKFFCEKKNIRFAKYGDDYLNTDDKARLCGVEGITLEKARELRDADMLVLHDMVKAFKAKQDPRSLTNGGFYAIIETVVKDFAKCRVYAPSRDIAASIQRRLKELLRRMEIGRQISTAE